MKIIISGTSSWSIWKFRKNFINYLERKNYVIYYFLKEKNYLNKVSNKNYNFIHSFSVFYFIDLWKLLKNYKIKLVLEYDLKNLIKHKILRLFYKDYKIIVIWAGLGNQFNLKDYFNLLEKLTLKLLLKECEKVILINRYDYEIVKKYNLHRSLAYIKTEGFIHRNLKNPRLKQKTKYKFVSAFRPIKTKGIYEIINAAKNFAEHDFYIYTVKNNENIKYNTINEDLTAFKKYKNIFIKEIVNNFEKEVTKYDCLISASYGEGFGMSIAEAVNNLIPVISTKVSGPRAIFQNKNLIYIEPKSNEELIKGIKIFINLSKKEKINMTLRAKEDLEKIDNKRIFKRIESLISEAS